MGWVDESNLDVWRSKDCWGKLVRDYTLKLRLEGRVSHATGCRRVFQGKEKAYTK